VAFFGLVCLALLNQKRDSLSSTERSEMFGWIFGSNLEVIAISEQKKLE